MAEPGRGHSGSLWFHIIVVLFIHPLSPRDVSVELPFVLMHPKPHDHITLPRPQSGEHSAHPAPPARPVEKP